MGKLDRRKFLALAGSAAVPFALGAVSSAVADISIEARYFDDRFRRIGPEPTARVRRLATGMDFTEGPCWFADGGYLLFSDVPDDKIWRHDVASGRTMLFREPSNHANGLARDGRSRLVICEHAGRRVSRVEADGSTTILADRFEGKRFNSPNDLALHRNGSIWFTDPDYGLESRREMELPLQAYRLDPDSGALSVVADDAVKPNGICFAPDYAKLYVSDSARPFKIFIYDVIDGRRLSKPRQFGERLVGLVDGLACDSKGNVWASSGGQGALNNGVQVFAPDGTLIGFIWLPELCSNVCFGGENMSQLFMTASSSLYGVDVSSHGF